MSVKIGSARSSYGHTEAGDQAGGREVSTQSWYMHSKGWVVLRPINAADAEAIAVAMERACANDHIGYSQPARGTLYSQIKSKGFDPAKATKDCCTDCSALVRVCCCYAGIMVGNFTTSDEVSTLMKTGCFEKLTADKYCGSSAYLNRGDILCTRTKGHTVVVLSDGSKATKRTVAAATETIHITGAWFVREQPDKASSALGTVRDTDVTLIGIDVLSGWLHIKTQTMTGWVSPKAVKTDA